MIRTMPPVTRQLTATSTTELFEPITGWMLTLECMTMLLALVKLTYRGSNFQCRLAIQTAGTDLDAADAPTHFASAATQIGTIVATRYRLDPNGSTDGDIDNKMFFRIGLLYSLSTGSTPAQGTVEIGPLAWR